MTGPIGKPKSKIDPFAKIKTDAQMGRCDRRLKITEPTVDLQAIINGAIEYEDGELGFHRCLELYCTEHGIVPGVAERALAEFVRQEARAAGIPLSVIEGKTKLTDHFSPEYIDFKCGSK